MEVLNINGLQLKKKGFAGNNDARRYQRQASGHEDFNFEYNGKSYDNIVTESGITTMIDRKAGYGYSIFEPVTGDIRSQTIKQSLIDKATEQVNNLQGSGLKLRWEISTEVGAAGIKSIFEQDRFLNGKIDVVFEELLP